RPIGDGSTDPSTTPTVVPGAEIREEEVLGLLCRLVEKSLVLLNEGLPEDTRYRMLEATRQYAGAKLATSGEAEAVRDRHAGAFLDLAERMEPATLGLAPSGALAMLEREHDNLRAALRRLINRGEVDSGFRMVNALRRFWFVRGHWTEATERLSDLLALAQ